MSKFRSTAIELYNQWFKTTMSAMQNGSKMELEILFLKTPRLARPLLRMCL